jgi:hypothetical protein
VRAIGSKGGVEKVDCGVAAEKQGLRGGIHRGASVTK